MLARRPRRCRCRCHRRCRAVVAAAVAVAVVIVIVVVVVAVVADAVVVAVASSSSSSPSSSVIVIIVIFMCMFISIVIVMFMLMLAFVINMVIVVLFIIIAVLLPSSRSHCLFPGTDDTYRLLLAVPCHQQLEALHAWTCLSKILGGMLTYGLWHAQCARERASAQETASPRSHSEGGILGVPASPRTGQPRP